MNYNGMGNDPFVDAAESASFPLPCTGKRSGGKKTQPLIISNPISLYETSVDLNLNSDPAQIGSLTMAPKNIIKDSKPDNVAFEYWSAPIWGSR